MDSDDLVSSVLSSCIRLTSYRGLSFESCAAPRELLSGSVIRIAPSFPFEPLMFMQEANASISGNNASASFFVFIKILLIFSVSNICSIYVIILLSLRGKIQ